MAKSTHLRVWLLACAIGLSACDSRAPSGPTPIAPPPPPPPPPPPTVVALTVTAISPPTGSTAGPTRVTIRGTGFISGATVNADAMALNVTVVDSTTITALVPAHAAALVDVIVTNVGGLRATLTAAFTYAFEAPYTLTAHTDTVVAGDQISVSWSAPRGELEDWIALCKVGQAYDDDWYDFTKGATSGTLTVAAPTQPGQYEFRYLFDDTFEVLAQSRPVTVR
jgi:hypothetical protein